MNPSATNEFLLVIPNTKVKNYNLFALFIICCSIIIFGLILASSARDGRTNYLLLGVVGIPLYFLWTKFYLRETSISGFVYISFFIVASIWFFISQFAVACVTAVLFLLYIKSIQALRITVNAKGIRYPSLLVKNLKWETLSNIILKDGLITIDQKNNKIIQQAIDESKTSVNEKEFNEFCRQQLSK